MSNLTAPNVFLIPTSFVLWLEINVTRPNKPTEAIIIVIIEKKPNVFIINLISYLSS